MNTYRWPTSMEDFLYLVFRGMIKNPRVLLSESPSYQEAVSENGTICLPQAVSHTLGGPE